MAFYEPNQGSQRPPPCPPPWYAEWDSRDQRWLYINPQDGERTFEHPHPNYQQAGYGGGYPPQQGGYGGGYGQRGGEYGRDYPQPPAPQHKDHRGLEYGALGAVGGVVAGAFAMHEGEKIREFCAMGPGERAVVLTRACMIDRDYDYDKDRIEGDLDYDKDRIENRYDYDRDRVENRVDYDVDRVEDFPDDTARWAGREEQRVEDFPDDAARWAGREEQKFDDIPEDAAGWAGRKVGDVERFDDNVDDSFDYGRDEQRYDDDRF